jgi:ankyrin repeat protein
MDFTESCKRGNLEAVKRLIDEAIITAALYGNSDIVKYLTVLPGVKVEYALENACIEGYTDLVRFLVGLPNICLPKNLIILASSNGHLDIVKILCSLPGVDIGVDESQALIDAAMNGHVETVKYLLPRLDPLAQDNGALFQAINYYNPGVIEALMAHQNYKFDPQDDQADRKLSIWCSSKGYKYIAEVLACRRRLNYM